jgi:dTDP-4-amino-4,6-dideoxygalactose transaminase
MRGEFLPFSPPLIGEEEIGEVVDTLRSDWITSGPKTKRFERDFAAYVGAQGALALNSATAALHVALATLGIGPGDAVISTPMTFCSSLHVIEHMGARPILVDVEPDTLNIDPARIVEVIERSAGRHGMLRAILPVHLYGHPCEMDALLRIANEHGLAIVEDAAHALPASYKDHFVGSFDSARSGFPVPILTAFSFYATKNMTTAEGGMLTGPSELIEEARIWSLHGMSRDAWKRYSSQGSWFYEVVRAGFKYNMTDLQASIGIHQLRRLPDMQKRRHAIFGRYDEAFADLAEIQRPTVRPEIEHARHLYVIRLHLERLTIDRGRFIEEMKARNIATSVHFIPNHIHPYYRDKYGYKPEDFPIAYNEYHRMLTLPLYPRMTDLDVQDVIEAVQDVVRCFRR